MLKTFLSVEYNLIIWYTEFVDLFLNKLNGIINMKKIRRFYAMKDAVVRIEGIEIENFKNLLVI